MSLNNKEFGELLAEACYKSGLKEIPIVLNSEQYDAFRQKYKKLIITKNEVQWSSMYYISSI